MSELGGELAAAATAEQQAEPGLAAVSLAGPEAEHHLAGQEGESIGQPKPDPGSTDASSEVEPAAQNATPACAPSPGVPTPATNPRKKRKVAVLMAYVGHGYAGMQRNPGVKTIEDDLFRAIAAAGGISEANADDAGFSKIHWMRAARTDKGVSAVGQVVSLRMVLEDAEIQAKINDQLPSQIRVFGFGRATHGFDARKHCDKRRYEYILPAWAFDPALVPESSLLIGDDGPQAPGLGVAGAGDEPAAGQAAPNADQADQAAAGVSPEPSTAADKPEASAVDTLQKEQGEGAGLVGSATAAAQEEVEDEEPCEAMDPAAAAELQAKLSHAETGFVFDEACAERMSGILQNFQGTHNFHNFTVGTLANAPNARRYILSFKCQGAFTINGQPWVRLVVIGQSFMLHQIRKMVGLAMAVYRGAAPMDAIPVALRARINLNVPMAPSLGLFLDECYYDAYNNQFGQLHGEIHLSDFQDQVDAFKKAELYPHIADQDAKECVNAEWFQNLTDKCYRFRAWRKAAQSGTPLHRPRGQRPGSGPPKRGNWDAPAPGPKRTRFGRPKPEPRTAPRKPDSIAAGTAAEFSD